MKKLLITLGISGSLMTGCQTARETTPEANTIAPAVSGDASYVFLDEIKEFIGTDVLDGEGINYIGTTKR